MNLPSAKLARTGALTTESPLRDLEVIIRSRTPLIAVESNEEPQIVRMVRQIGQRLQIKAYCWTVTEGLQAFEPCDQPSQSVLKSQEVLNYIKSSASHCLFVLLDFHPYLQDRVHVRQLKDIALTYPRHDSTVVLVGCTLQMPEEPRPYTARFRLPLPTPEELRRIVYDVAADWGAEHGHRDVQTTNKALDRLVRNLAGLTATDARRLAEKAINDDGAISESDIPEVMRARYELLGHDGLLSFEYDTVKFSEGVFPARKSSRSSCRPCTRRTRRGVTYCRKTSSPKFIRPGRCRSSWRNRCRNSANGPPIGRCRAIRVVFVVASPKHPIDSRIGSHDTGSDQGLKFFIHFRM
jgi:hypothetical protein